MKFELDAFNRDVPDEELLRDLAITNEKLNALGDSLTYRSYSRFGKYSSGTLAVRFGTWNDALRKAGINPVLEKNVSAGDLFDNLKVVWIAKGKQPVLRDMSISPSRYTASIYASRFGSWRKALQQFVTSVSQEEIEFQSSKVGLKSDSNTTTTKRDPSLTLRFLVLKRDRFSCVSCGRSPALIPGLILEIDHHIPWSKGGETIEANLKTLCFDCNRGKGAT